MSTVQASIEQLIRDLLELEDVSIVIHSSLFWMIVYGKHGPVEKIPMGWSTLANVDWLRVGSEQWKFYTRLGGVQRVRFERDPNPHAEGQEQLGVILLGQDGERVGCYLGHLYDEQGKPIAARFALWEELRAKYGGRDELRVEDGRLTS